MGTNQDEDDDLGEISEIYDLLKQDVKNLIGDLDEGVNQFRSSSLLLIFLSLLGFFFPAIILLSRNLRGVGVAGTLILGPACAIGAVIILRKYLKLKKKYSRLFELAKRLN